MNGIVNEKKGHNIVNNKNYQFRGILSSNIFSLAIMNDKKATIVNDKKVKKYG